MAHLQGLAPSPDALAALGAQPSALHSDGARYSPCLSDADDGPPISALAQRHSAAANTTGVATPALLAARAFGAGAPASVAHDSSVTEQNKKSCHHVG